MTSNGPHPDHDNRVLHDEPLIQLRLLETTDVHSNLLPFDYFTGRSDTGYGLAHTTTLIRAARNEVQNCMLFDNGDFLQGTPMSDMTAQIDSGWPGPHPSIIAMNLLDYDAATLGNHEFNFGLEWLKSTLLDAQFPTVCANAVIVEGGNIGTYDTFLPPYLILERALTDTDGTVHTLRIGVLGLVPPQVTTWDHFHLEGRIEVFDIIETARACVPRMRAQGADLVVALAHTGIDSDAYYPLKENVAIALGQVPGIDAILAGHTHEVFPAPGTIDIEGVDHIAGTVGGTPAVMAGFRGSHLGVLDLELRQSPKGWRVAHHRAEARPVKQGTTRTPVAKDTTLCQHLMPAHDHTLRLVDQPLGQSQVPLHSYLALVRNDPATQLITRAQHAAMVERLHGSEFEGIPILSASAPFKTGGRGGPQYYTDVPPGDLRLRNAADLYAFPNTLCGLHLTGAQLQDWLERAAGCFGQIIAGKADQMLCDPLVPGHNFDVIHGLTYVIDLSQPARYDRAGRLRNTAARRIHKLQYKGQPVTDNARFVMATNSFRAYGGGPYPSLSDECILGTNRQPIRDILAQYIQTNGASSHRTEQVWSFAPMPGTQVVFDTGPDVRQYPADLDALGATDIGTTDDGFARFSLCL